MCMEPLIYMYYACSSIGGHIVFHCAACLEVDLILLMCCQTVRFHPNVYPGIAFVCSSNEVELEMHIALPAKYVSLEYSLSVSHNASIHIFPLKQERRRRAQDNFVPWTIQSKSLNLTTNENMQLETFLISLAFIFTNVKGVTSYFFHTWGQLVIKFSWPFSTLNIFHATHTVQAHHLWTKLQVCTENKAIFCLNYIKLHLNGNAYRTELKPLSVAINCWIQCFLCAFCTRLQYIFFYYTSCSFILKKINKILILHDFIVLKIPSKVKLILWALHTVRLHWERRFALEVWGIRRYHWGK